MLPVLSLELSSALELDASLLLEDDDDDDDASLVPEAVVGSASLESLLAGAPVVVSGSLSGASSPHAVSSRIEHSGIDGEHFTEGACTGRSGRLAVMGQVRGLGGRIDLDRWV
jgi:hypothetical protein